MKSFCSVLLLLFGSYILVFAQEFFNKNYVTTNEVLSNSNGVYVYESGKNLRGNSNDTYRELKQEYLWYADMYLDEIKNRCNPPAALEPYIHLSVRPKFNEGEVIQLIRTRNADATVRRLSPLQMTELKLSHPVGELELFGDMYSNSPASFKIKFQKMESDACNYAFDIINQDGDLELSFQRRYWSDLVDRCKLDMGQIVSSKAYRKFISPIKGTKISIDQVYAAAMEIYNELETDCYTEISGHELFENVIEPIVDAITWGSKEVRDFHNASKEITDLMGGRYKENLIIKESNQSESEKSDKGKDSYLKSDERFSEDYNSSKKSGVGGLNVIGIFKVGGGGGSESMYYDKTHNKFVVNDYNEWEKLNREKLDFKWEGEKRERFSIKAYEDIKKDMNEKWVIEINNRILNNEGKTRESIRILR